MAGEAFGVLPSALGSADAFAAEVLHCERAAALPFSAVLAHPSQFEPATKMDRLFSASCVSDIHFNAGKARLHLRLLLLGREKVKLG